MKIKKKGKLACEFSVAPGDSLELQYDSGNGSGLKTVAQHKIDHSAVYDSYIIFEIDENDEEFDSNEGLGGIFLDRKGREDWD